MGSSQECIQTLRAYAEAGVKTARLLIYRAAVNAGHGFPDRQEAAIAKTFAAEMAIQAALTGHLVISTLHTNDAPTAVTRMLDLGSHRS